MGKVVDFISKLDLLSVYYHHLSCTFWGWSLSQLSWGKGRVQPGQVGQIHLSTFRCTSYPKLHAFKWQKGVRVPTKQTQIRPQTGNKTEPSGYNYKLTTTSPKLNPKFPSHSCLNCTTTQWQVALSKQSLTQVYEVFEFLNRKL